MAIISWYTAVGLFAQLLFTSRMLVQWILSEKAHRVVNPSIFWWLSLGGALVMSFYGYLRHDLAILLGQFLSYYAYLCNLKLKGQLQKIGLLASLILVIIPIALIAHEVTDLNVFKQVFLNHEYIPYPLLIFGMIGQLCFTLRFILQTIISLKKGESLLPRSFWLISMTGCIIVLIYGILRLDVVLILGQSMGLVTYVRNFILGKK